MTRRNPGRSRCRSVRPTAGRDRLAGPRAGVAAPLAAQSGRAERQWHRGPRGPARSTPASRAPGRPNGRSGVTATGPVLGADTVGRGAALVRRVGAGSAGLAPPDTGCGAHGEVGGRGAGLAGDRGGVERDPAQAGEEGLHPRMGVAGGHREVALTVRCRMGVPEHHPGRNAGHPQHDRHGRRVLLAEPAYGWSGRR